MNKLFCCSILLFCAGLVTYGSTEPQTKGSEPSKTAVKNENSKAWAKIRREEAVSLLMSLASDAQDFDPQLRSQLQAQAANLLWRVDRVFARDLYLKAWDAAETADQNSSKLQDGETRPSVYPRDARREVVILVMQNDPVFGRQLLERISKQEADSVKSDSASTKTDQPQSSGLSSSDFDRLTIARKLLENGDINQARELAGEALNTTVIPTLRFLSELRRRDARVADELYVSLVARAEADPGADANTVSLLSSYVFSPDLYVRISNNGFPIIVHSTELLPPPDMPNNIRFTFLQTAAKILLRPATDPLSQRSAFMIGTRLLPLFDEFSPRLANQLRAKLMQTSSSISSALKSSETVNTLRKGIGSSDTELNSVDELLKEADRLSNPSARDGLFIRAAMLAAEHGDSRAANIVQQISSDELKKQALPYVLLALSKNALAHKQFEKAIQFARSEELTGIQRIWIYMQILKLNRSKDAEAAVDFLLEAVQIARRIRNDADKARAMVAIASQFMKFNSGLAKEYVAEALKMADKVADFDGEDTAFTVRIESSFGDWTMNYLESGFSLTNLFLQLAKDDFFQAVHAANSLQRRDLKSAAILTIARSAIDEDHSMRRGD